MFHIQKMPGCITILCVKQMYFLQIIASAQHRLAVCNVYRVTQKAYL